MIGKQLFLGCFVIAATFLPAITSFAQTDSKFLKWQDKSIIMTRFSPDGKKLASLSADKTIRIWDVLTGSQIKCLDDQSEGDVCIEFSPDGKYIASGNWDKTVKIWDIEKGKVVKTLIGHSQATRCISYHPEGKLVASAGWDDVIKIWYASTGLNLKNLSGHTQCVRAMSFSPDGRTLASGGYDLMLKVWNITDGKQLFSVKAHSYPIEALDYSPDGKLIATGGMENVIKIWNSSNGSLIKVLKGHTDAVYSLEFSPDGKYLVSGSNDNLVIIWDVETGTQKQTFKGHTLGIRTVAFNPNGKSIVSGGIDKSIRIWNVSSLNITPSPVYFDNKFVESEEKEVIKWLQPNSGTAVSFLRHYPVKIGIKDPGLKHYQLFLNRVEYSNYDGKTKIPVKPMRISVNAEQVTEITYDVYLEPGENELQLFAESYDENMYAFSQPVYVRFFDIEQQRKQFDLFIVVINPEQYFDKKLNQGYTKDQSDKFEGIIKTQTGKSFRNVIVNDISTGKNKTGEQMIHSIDSIAGLCSPNDLMLVIYNGYLLQDAKGNITFPDADANLKTFDSSLTNLCSLVKCLHKIPGFGGIIVDVSAKMQKPPAGYTNAAGSEVYNTVNKELSFKKQYVIIVVEDQTNLELFDIIANSFHPENDEDNNKAIDFDEISSFIKEICIEHYLLKSGYLPIFIHSVEK